MQRGDLGAGIAVTGALEDGFATVLTPASLAFVAELHRQFNGERERLLERRRHRAAELRIGMLPDFLPATRPIREGNWKVPPPPADLLNRRVEITGPVERKMIINALNSGANVFMADFEDANAPTWTNVIGGQLNLIDAVAGTIAYTSPEGKTYRLGDQLATLVVRPRGWHLTDKHVWVDGKPISASLLDFGLYLFHNTARLLEKGTGPYLYLPKLESHLEARLWHQVFEAAEHQLHLRPGTIRATVLIETIHAAFEMEEILHELGAHAAGLNAGRWDYIFSIIKTFPTRREFVLPDRAQVTMAVPFMHAYTQLLVKTCHRRGAHAIGGMAAFIPNRKDPIVTERALAKVREDKIREAGDGFDGTWVAHPDLVQVAKAPFDQVLGPRPHQVPRQRDDVTVSAQDLLDIRVPGGTVTEAGLRNNVSVAIQYLESWLRGMGAAAIYNLMEDAATAEIARAQVWQWIRHGVRLHEGPVITQDLVRHLAHSEIAGRSGAARPRFEQARALFESVALPEDCPDFLTLPAYEHLA